MLVMIRSCDATGKVRLDGNQVIRETPMFWKQYRGKRLNALTHFLERSGARPRVTEVEEGCAKRIG